MQLNRLLHRSRCPKRFFNSLDFSSCSHSAQVPTRCGSRIAQGKSTHNYQKMWKTEAVPGNWILWLCIFTGFLDCFLSRLFVSRRVSKSTSGSAKLFAEYLLRRSNYLFSKSGMMIPLWYDHDRRYLPVHMPTGRIFYQLKRNSPIRLLKPTTANEA